MGPFVRYSLQRVIQYIAVILIGTTVVFAIPRLSSVDPVEIAVSRAAMVGQYQNPEAVEKMRQTLTELYGMKGSIFEQYLKFWKRLSRGDFGPSLSAFPTPVIILIKNSLPWTVGLLIVSILISWFIGNMLGGLAGYFSRQRWSRVLGIIAMSAYPIPYYIMALALVILLVYVFPVFPVVGGCAIGSVPSFSWDFLIDLFKHAFLPALSLVIIGIGGWFLTMRSVISRVVGEDYVIYAKVVGLPKDKILFQYVMRNAILPQITGLALQIGMIFNGALITEYVFSYPGLGQLLYIAVTRGDFNLMIGIVILSIIAISTTVLIVDLAYPLFDPRIRYR